MNDDLINKITGLFEAYESLETYWTKLSDHEESLKSRNTLRAAPEYRSADVSFDVEADAQGNVQFSSYEVPKLYKIISSRISNGFLSGEASVEMGEAAVNSSDLQSFDTLLESNGGQQPLKIFNYGSYGALMGAIQKAEKFVITLPQDGLSSYVSHFEAEIKALGNMITSCEDRNQLSQSSHFYHP